MALVMIVDDDMSFRFFLKALFETEGHRAVACRSGGEALERLSAVRPDLITLDVMMPGRGGLDMYRALQGNGQWRTIPVIMLSGVKAGAYAHALAMSGAAGESLPEPYAYVEKPPRPEHLLELARPVLARADTKEDA